MKRDSLVWGLILILAGLGFLLFQRFPGLWATFSWPWILVGVGAVFAIGSFLSRKGGLMIPALIIAGLGGILLYQTVSGNWDSWAYVWTVIPGLVGLGMLVGGLYDDEMKNGRTAGFILIAISAAAFAIFGGLLGSDISWLRYWPIMLIAVGAFVLLRALWPSSDKSKSA